VGEGEAIVDGHTCRMSMAGVDHKTGGTTEAKKGEGCRRGDECVGDLIGFEEEDGKRVADNINSGAGNKRRGEVEIRSGNTCPVRYALLQGP
jgi:hypothetical protein